MSQWHHTPQKRGAGYTVQPTGHLHTLFLHLVQLGTPTVTAQWQPVSFHSIHSGYKPQMMSQLYMNTHLSGHYFSICACNIYACIKARPVVSLNNFSGIHLVSPNATVVWSLGARKAICRPPKWTEIRVQKGVFLLYSKPGFRLCSSLDCLQARTSVVCGCKFTIT